MKVYFICTVLLLGLVTLSIAHGGKKHRKDSTAAQNDTAKRNREEHFQGDTVNHRDQGMKPDESKVTADLDDFPSLHPLIVHFAIVLIIVAAALQLLNVVLLKKELAWMTAVILLIGFLAAWFAGKDLHPHTHGLTKHAEMVLEQHEKFADWTINTAMVGVALQIAYLFLLRYSKAMKAAPVEGIDGFTSKLNRIGTVVITLVLLTSAYCVSRAGHYGSQLVHIEGVGPQGKFLEMEHEH